VKINAFTFTRLIGLLMEGTRTMQELADDTGLHYVTVQSYCRAMFAQRVIHIAAYAGVGRDACRVYKLGRGENARRRRKSRKDITRDYRARVAARRPLPIEVAWQGVTA
jgi:hypothetical protein